MSIQLQIDEMLEILDYQDNPSFEQLRDQAEYLATVLAAAVSWSVPELTQCGPAEFAGLGFAGTCVPFEPTAPGPCPKVLIEFDIEVQEWENMQ